jgi:hypothetical protein
MATGIATPRLRVLQVMSSKCARSVATWKLDQDTLDILRVCWNASTPNLWVTVRIAQEVVQRVSQGENDGRIVDIHVRPRPSNRFDFRERESEQYWKLPVVKNHVARRDALKARADDLDFALS